MGESIISGLVSGVVSGFIVGVVLLWIQQRNQISNDDTLRIITILHSVESAREKAGTLAMTSVQDKQSVRDEILNLLESVASEAQRLLSSQHKLLRAYLVLRIKMGRFSLRENPLLCYLELSELVNDIHTYIDVPRDLLGSVKYQWMRLRGIHRPSKAKFTEVQKELIIQGSKKDNPVHSYELLANVPFNQAEEVVKVLGGLVEDGYFQDIGLDKYCLTSKGWREAVQLRNGDYDSSIGFRAN